MKRVAITVTGKVQGVGFRAATSSVARQLNVTGYVVNQDNGSVLIEAQSDHQNLDSLLEWCKAGPKYAKVKGTLVRDLETIPGEQSFEIKR
ncbi:MAG: acylphosphatase [Bdellovibrionales bacterium]|nr:acylphosphatase [Bdellovibrionales bacterium]